MKILPSAYSSQHLFFIFLCLLPSYLYLKTVNLFFCGESKRYLPVDLIHLRHDFNATLQTRCCLGNDSKGFPTGELLSQLVQIQLHIQPLRFYLKGALLKLLKISRKATIVKSFFFFFFFPAVAWFIDFCFQVYFSKTQLVSFPFH